MENQSVLPQTAGNCNTNGGIKCEPGGIGVCWPGGATASPPPGLRGTRGWGSRENAACWHCVPRRLPREGLTPRVASGVAPDQLARGVFPLGTHKSSLTLRFHERKR